MSSTFQKREGGLEEDEDDEHNVDRENMSHEVMFSKHSNLAFDILIFYLYGNDICYMVFYLLGLIGTP